MLLTIHSNQKHMWK